LTTWRYWTPGPAARAVLRRGRGAAAAGDRLRRDVLAYARSTNGTDDQRRAAGADQRGRVHRRDGRGCGRGHRRQRVLRRGPQHVRESRGSPGSGRDPQPSDQGASRAQRPLPRRARASGDPVRAARSVRQSRTVLGRGPHRPPRARAGLHRRRRSRAREHHRGDRRWDSHLDSPDAARQTGDGRAPGSSCSAPATT
jgi:hypothetical protein